MATTRTVMVVDDSPDLRNALADVLEGHGCEVVLAGDGDEALSLLKSGKKPGLILLDLIMPNRGGYDFRHAQRNDRELANIPVVLMTASVAGTTAAETMGLPLLKKPMQAVELLQMIDYAFD